MSGWSSLSRPLLALLAVTTLAACSGEVTYEEPPRPSGTHEVTSNLTTEAKRERARTLKRVAAEEGLTNAIVLAGIAEGETNFAHCWDEATWACKGPDSDFCGGPVIAGSGDGPCADKQGGLGMFQFDGGTHSQTLNRDGRDILSLEGNFRHAVDFVTDMTTRSGFIEGVDTRQEALDWLNAVEVGGPRYHTWIKTVTAYYNGCFPNGCSIYEERYNHYDNAHQSIYDSLGADFWSSSQPDDGQEETERTAPAVPGQAGPDWTEIDNKGTLDLEWDDGGASSFVVHMDVGEGSDNWSDYYEWRTDGSPFKVWPQQNDKEYRWRVKACNAVGCSDWTSWRAFAVGQVGSAETNEQPEEPEEEESGPTDAFGAPGGLTPSDARISTPRVELDWRPVDQSTAYVVNVRYWDGDTETWNHYNTWSDVGTDSMTLWPTLEGRTYAWRVRACSWSQCSGWSNWSMFFFE